MKKTVIAEIFVRDLISYILYFFPQVRNLVAYKTHARIPVYVTSSLVTKTYSVWKLANAREWNFYACENSAIAVFKTTQTSVDGAFIVSSSVLKFGTPLLHIQAQKKEVTGFWSSFWRSIWKKSLPRRCFTPPSQLCILMNRIFFCLSADLSCFSLSIFLYPLANEFLQRTLMFQDIFYLRHEQVTK